MATKRKRARKKKANPTKKRAHAKRAKSAAAPARRRRRKRALKANPKRSHARRTRRATRSNPRRRTHAKRSHARKRRAVANPRRRGRHLFRKRAHRRNPAIPVWALAGLAAALGLVSYAVANDGSFALTQRTDPTLATLQRNRYIVSGVMTAVGLALAAFASPILGAGVAAGGLASLAGTQLSLAIGKLIDKRNPDGSLQTAQLSASSAARLKGLGAVFDGADQQHLAGVFGPAGVQQFGMGAVFNGGSAQHFGEVTDQGQGAGSYFAG